MQTSDKDYWLKAKTESDQTLERLLSAIKYETAVNEMCAERLLEAEHAEPDNS